MYLHTWSTGGAVWNGCGNSETWLAEVGNPGQDSEGQIPAPSLDPSLRTTETPGTPPACLDQHEICHVSFDVVVVASQTVSQNKSSPSVKLFL